MKLMSVKEIIYKLTGDICPTGKHEVDMSIRKENLETLISLVSALLFQICVVAESKGDPRISVNMLGDLAERFLQQVHTNLEESSKFSRVDNWAGDC